MNQRHTRSWSNNQRYAARILALVIAGLLLSSRAAAAHGAELKQKTIQAFDQYVRLAESRMQNDLQNGDFLWIDALPPEQRTAAYQHLRNGEILVKPMAAGRDVPDGMIHDWMGIAFIPGGTIDQVLGVLQNYDAAHIIYGPEVTRSKLLSRDGNHFRVSLQLQKHTVVTVAMNVINDVHYTRLDALRAESRSQSVQINEVENPGTPNEREEPPGQGHGYLWRMNNYARYRQDDAGVYVQIEIIALSRGMPFGLGWLIKPLVKHIPAQSLTLTLSRTRDAVENQREAVAKNGRKVGEAANVRPD